MFMGLTLHGLLGCRLCAQTGFGCILEHQFPSRDDTVEVEVWGASGLLGKLLGFCFRCLGTSHLSQPKQKILKIRTTGTLFHTPKPTVACHVQVQLVACTCSSTERRFIDFSTVE
jgi:hypothetical protein